jgi:hypothetical protein
MKLLGFVAENKKIPLTLTQYLSYAHVRQHSSGGVYTFEYGKRESRSRTNDVDEDNRSRPQGRVVEQVDEGRFHKREHLHSSTHVQCIDVSWAPF